MEVVTSEAKGELDREGNEPREIAADNGCYSINQTLTDPSYALHRPCMAYALEGEEEQEHSIREFE